MYKIVHNDTAFMINNIEKYTGANQSLLIDYLLYFI